MAHAYLLKMSITHNKKRIFLLNLLISCISARSVPQTLSIKAECTFLFSNLLIIGSANSLLDILSFLIAELFECVASPKVFLSKNL